MENKEPIGNSEQLMSLDKAFKFAEWCGDNADIYEGKWTIWCNEVKCQHEVCKKKITTEELFKLFEEENKLNQK